MGLLQGKIGIVTGSGRGIGRATALLAAREGSAVTVAELKESRGLETVREIEAAGGRAHFVQVDVREREQVEAMVAETVEVFGGLDWASNNAAGRMAYGHVTEIEPEAWQETLDVMLTGVWLCMRAEIPAMLASGGGAIVNIASMLAISGSPMMAAYAAAKGGVVSLTRSAAAEYALDGIRVNAVNPGLVDTPGSRQTLSADLERATSAMAMARLGTPEEIAEAIVWLCSDRSSFATGECLAIDGGIQVKLPTYP
ncbi:MAG: glucose 1-dehydrogenase [Deltaproteobacteria bacterium]|jgi:NAD(P)-dependent dehydrogenase (short-subunit alcohol dehydrogenase family)|nr:glucose 1-dehydrogenase [Deltaproteobacteria bacterium]